MMTSKRAEVLGEQIRQILSTALIYEMRDAALHGVLITGIRVSGDLGYADIRIQVPEGEHSDKRALSALGRARGVFKRLISSQIRLRKVPELRFHIDENLLAERRIQDILQGLDIPPEDSKDDAAT